MDYYSQPRPVLYGTAAEEAPPPTQTAPVRVGPPRYPPAPPTTGYAPEPFPQNGAASSPTVMDGVRRAILIAVALVSAYYFLTPALNPGSVVSPLVGGVGLIVLALVPWRTGWEYRMAVSLAVLNVLGGVAFAPWQSPALWVAVAVTLYLLRPSMLEQYEQVPSEVISGNAVTEYSLHPSRRRRVRVASRRPAGLEPWEWRIRW